jgi:hypothetical protein
MSDKYLFLEIIRQTLDDIACRGAIKITQMPPSGNNPDRIIHIDSWRCKETVSDYDQKDFANDLSPADLKALSNLVEEFRTLTAPYGGTDRVPNETALEVDRIIARIAKILANQISSADAHASLLTP